MTPPEAGLAGTQLSREPVLSGKGSAPWHGGVSGRPGCARCPRGAWSRWQTANHRATAVSNNQAEGCLLHPADALGPMNKKGVSFAFLNSGTLMPVLSVICWAEGMPNAC